MARLAEERGSCELTELLMAALEAEMKGSIMAAREILLRGEGRFSNEPIFQFAVATYDCAMNYVELAKARLTAILKVDPSARAAALENKMLMPLWAWLSHAG